MRTGSSVCTAQRQNNAAPNVEGAELPFTTRSDGNRVTKGSILRDEPSK